MKTAVIPEEGKAILGAKMDHRQGETFYELKFVGENTTHCRWVADSSIENEGDL